MIQFKLKASPLHCMNKWEQAIAAYSVYNQITEEISEQHWVCALATLFLEFYFLTDKLF